MSEIAWRAFANSAIISTIATAISVAVGTLAAYGMLRFPKKHDGFALQLLSVRMFPPIAVVVPLVILFSALKLADTHLGLILAYAAFTLPFSTWMIRSIEEVPTELEGVARIYGMSQFGAFVHIVLPLIRGGLLATALFVFILNWSEFLRALTLTSGGIVTVTLQVANCVSASSGKLYGVQAAMGTISTIPVIVFGYLIQRHMVRGLTFGAVKR
ncbi:carbohydrate ABC transporter permease [Acidisoma sp. S159]|uniref:carbohydrate ABC transporter permease n=1 Tax=Acidisoma sp. S159 TaxID=1747225 RepID=UPI00131C3919|nr:carbohydrate ABC transporter permease [Acidisoma sp. S159]